VHDLVPAQILEGIDALRRGALVGIEGIVLLDVDAAVLVDKPNKKG